VVLGIGENHGGEQTESNNDREVAHRA
jgi:hypothetical protein